MNEFVTLWLASRTLAEASRRARASEGDRREAEASSAARRSAGGPGGLLRARIAAHLWLFRPHRPAGARGADPCTCTCTCQP